MMIRSIDPALEETGDGWNCRFCETSLDAKVGERQNALAEVSAIDAKKTGAGLIGPENEDLADSNKKGGVGHSRAARAEIAGDRLLKEAPQKVESRLARNSASRACCQEKSLAEIGFCILASCSHHRQQCTTP
eukprot:2634948-Pleurochrysis_carterae.AAC.1